MDVENDRLPEISPREAFLCAKVEFYLDQALECFAMARYHATLRLLSTVSGLDPENQVANELLSRTHERLKLLTRPRHADWLSNHQALGARRRDILAQFVVEAATLSSAGAALGIGTGLVLAFVVKALTPLPAAVAPWSIAVAVVLGVVVGVAAGVYPASRASRLDPIVALRAE